MFGIHFQHLIQLLHVGHNISLRWHMVVLKNDGYHNTFTIIVVIKLFSINSNVFQNQLLAMLDNLKCV